MQHFFNTVEAVAIFLIILSYIPKEQQQQQKALHASPCSVYNCCCFKTKL